MSVPSIKDLMNIKAATIKRPPRFPAATYVFQIDGWHAGTWSKSGGVGVAFDFRPVRCIDAEDDSQPELQAEITEQLEKFGDWTKKVLGKSVTWFTSREDQSTKLLVSPLTFTLQDAEGNLSAGASLLYCNDENGESGFVIDVLGLSGLQDKEIGEILDECINREFIGTLAWEPNEKRPDNPNLVLQPELAPVN